MRDSHEVRFSRHVHEVLDLDAHGESLGAIEARVGAMTADREEQSALNVLAFSLRQDRGAIAERFTPGHDRARRRISPRKAT